MKPIFVSQEQHDKLTAELHNLKRVERPRIVDAIKEAREHGDLSENAEYTAAKEKQVLVERKIARLEEMLSRARVLTDEMKIDSVVQIGNRVKVFDMNRNKEYEYELVPTTEFDTFSADAVSIDSPVGKALVGKSVGEIIEIKVPAGVLSYKVVEIFWPFFKSIFYPLSLKNPTTNFHESNEFHEFVQRLILIRANSSLIGVNSW